MTRAEQILTELLPKDSTVWMHKDLIVVAMERMAMKIWLDIPIDCQLTDWFTEDVTSQGKY